MITAEQQSIRRRKLALLRAGSTPRALEICSGCGGLSLGLKEAGFELTAHVEIDAQPRPAMPSISGKTVPKMTPGRCRATWKPAPLTS